MNKLFSIFFVMFALYSCTDEPETVNTPIATTPEVETFEGIEVLFDEDTFEYAKSVELLKEINICSTEKQEQLGLQVPDCSPEFFKLFPLKSDGKIENGFILLTKANTGGIALRRLIIFQRERGVLVKTNGFIGNLVGRKKSATGYDDLLIRFKELVEGDEVFYNCIVKWNGQKYEFKTVELIDVPASKWSARVKEEVKDSVSKEILKTITDNNMIF